MARPWLEFSLWKLRSPSAFSEHPTISFSSMGTAEVPVQKLLLPQSELLNSSSLWSIDTRCEQDASAPTSLALCLRQAVPAEYRMNCGYQLSITPLFSFDSVAWFPHGLFWQLFYVIFQGGSSVFGLTPSKYVDSPAQHRDQPNHACTRSPTYSCAWLVAQSHARGLTHKS